MAKVKKSTGLFTDKTIKRLITFYCYFYLISAIMAAIAMPFGLVPDSYPIIYVLACAITGVLSLGLFMRKSWIPMSVLIVAVVGLVSNVLSPIHGVFWVLSLVFLAFELFFFSTKDVKAYFSN